MSDQDIIRTLSSRLEHVKGIRALFLSGSHGTGLEDAYSDIDFLLVAQDGATDDIAAAWRKAIEDVGEIVLWWDRNLRPILINAITADWTRIDVVILKPDQLGMHRQDALKVVFDHDALFDGLPAETAAPAPNARHLTYQFEEFIRILGLLPLAVGRQEYINGVLGVFHLRNLLVDLMIAEQAVLHRGGALHLNRLISAEQKAALMQMPPPLPEKDAMIAGHLAYAKAFLPRARRLAKQWEVEWPERFEQVTWDMLHKTLGITRPYDPAES